MFQISKAWLAAANFFSKSATNKGVSSVASSVPTILSSASNYSLTSDYLVSNSSYSSLVFSSYSASSTFLASTASSAAAYSGSSVSPLKSLRSYSKSANAYYLVAIIAFLSWTYVRTKVPFYLILH